MPSANNLFAGLPFSVPQELTQTLLQSPGIRIERIISHGQSSPAGFWYDQPDDEWVLLLCGSACLQFDGSAPFDLTPGSFIHIPAHTRHRVDWTDPAKLTLWLAIHYPPGL